MTSVQEKRGTVLWFDRIIEAGSLVAVLSVPLFFNSYSLRSFEPDKAALLRSVATLMVLAWTAKAVNLVLESSRPKRRFLDGGEVDPRAISMLLATGFGSAVAISSFLSIAPLDSLWGSYTRQQGLITTGAYLVVFLSIAGITNERRQIDRIITALLIACAAIAVYGVLQQSGLDAIQWDRTGRSVVRSTMGNEIFIAAFLIMTIPLSLHRLIETIRSLRSDMRRIGTFVSMFCIGVFLPVATMLTGFWFSVFDGVVAALVVAVGWCAAGVLRKIRFRDAVRALAYSTLLSLQLACVILSESRGPFLGLLAGLFGFGLLAAVIYRRRLWIFALSGLAGTLLSLLIFANVPGSPLWSLQDIPTVGRLTRIFTTEGSAQVRLLIWEGSAELAASDPERLLVGYGPETLRLAFAPRYRAELGELTDRLSVPDRAHNHTFDLMIETGLIGVGVYYAFVLAVFHIGLRRVGVLTTSRQGWSFIAMSLTVAAAAAVGARLVDGCWRFLGLCPAAGMLISMFIFAVWRGIELPRSRSKAARTDRDLWPVPLVAALIGALVTHIVETQVGIATISTHLLFWVVSAVLVSVSRMEGPCAPIAKDWAGTDRTTAYFLIGLAVLTLSFDFTESGTDETVSTGFAWAFVGSFMLWGAIAYAETCVSSNRAETPIAVLEFVGFYGATALASMLVSRLAFTMATGDFTDFEPALVAFFVFAMAFVFLLAVGFAIDAGWSLRTYRPAPAVCGIVLLTAALTIGWSMYLEPIQADVFAKQGRFAQREDSEIDRAIDAYRRAVELAPRQGIYHSFLGSAYSDKALGSHALGGRAHWFEQAERSFKRARQLGPLDPDRIANLARLYWHWGEASNNAGMRKERLRKALSLLITVAEMTPQRALYWTEIGAVLAALDDLELAAAAYRRSLALDPRDAETANLLRLAYERLDQGQPARRAFEQGIEFEPEDLERWLVLGRIRERLGQIEEAARLYETVLKQDPDNAVARTRLEKLRTTTR